MSKIIPAVQAKQVSDAGWDSHMSQDLEYLRMTFNELVRESHRPVIMMTWRTIVGRRPCLDAAAWKFCNELKVAGYRVEAITDLCSQHYGEITVFWDGSV